MSVSADELRQALVRALVRDGPLHEGAVADAFRRVPRHVFLPDVPLDIVYRDSRVPTKLQGGEIVSSSSQPAIMAIMLEQLAAEPGHNVLEVGAGTGYNAALLAEIVGRSGYVTSIDLDAHTVERARSALAQAGYGSVRVEQADGAGGFPERASYDRIIATVGLGDIPLALWAQLSVGGRLVLPLMMRGVMKSVGFRKERTGELVHTSANSASFMPFRGAASLLLEELRVGPELGLFVRVAEPRRNVDTEALYAALHNPGFKDLRTDVRFSSRELRGGLNFWLRAHLASLVAVHAEGALAEDERLVPPFIRSPGLFPGVRDRLSIGLWERNELALMMATSGDSEPIQLGIRAWGGMRLAQQLLQCIQAWREAGSPLEDRAHYRLVPHGGELRSAAAIPMSAGTLEITWA